MTSTHTTISRFFGLSALLLAMMASTTAHAEGEIKKTYTQADGKAFAVRGHELSKTGKHAEALKARTKAAQIYQLIYSRNPKDHSALVDYVAALIPMARSAMHNQEDAQAVAVLEEAMLHSLQLDERFLTKKAFFTIKWSVDHYLAMAYRVSGRKTAALIHFESARGNAIRLADAAPEDYSSQRLFSLSSLNAVDLYFDRHDLGHAVRISRTAIAQIRESLIPVAGKRGEPYDMLSSHMLAEVRALSTIGRHEEALKIAHEALALHVKAIELDPSIRDARAGIRKGIEAISKRVAKSAAKEDKQPISQAE